MWLELEDNKWHYDYVRLAWDSGFSFGKSKYTNLDKNKIYMIDIDRIIKERDFFSVEKHISTVLQYVLDGEQAEILDTNFVNFFRMSQLSIEYLLFCKKYLDHTVTILKQDILKLKQELKQTKLYTEELETHISLLTKNNLVATFNCEKCSKAFSTEEYLNSHLKRRHNEEDKLNPNIEAEKLHMEIKELKERLNNTEKRILKDSHEIESDKLRDDELGAGKLINEIQKNFEKFREHVENKIESLHSEKNFYDDKYNKLFNIVLEYRNKEDCQKNNPVVQTVVEESPVKHSDMKESTTQTEKVEKLERLQVETIQNKNSYEFKENSTENLSVEVDHIDSEILEKKMNAFGETIENKISTGLFGIENQMKVFYEKLSKLESNQNINVDKIEQSIPVPSLSIENIHADEKPTIKPRTRFSKPTTLSKTDEKIREVEKIKTELDAILSKPTKEIVPQMVQSAVSNMNDTSDSETDSDSESVEKDQSDVIRDLKDTFTVEDKVVEENKVLGFDRRKPIEKSIVNVKKPKVVQKSTASVKKTMPVDNKHLQEKLREETIYILYSRLQEMGISPNWKGIPKKTFQRALEIVKHQANLSKKLLPNYDVVKRSIEKSIGSDKDLKKNTSESVKIDNSPNLKKEKPSVVKIRYKKKTQENETKSKPIVTIKNRSMYDTDSESEVVANHLLSPAKEIKKNQSAVIEELKSLQSKSIPAGLGDTDSDLNSILLSDDKNTVETKSAMKRFPSDGSLVKKKVLFDIERGEKDEDMLRKDGIITGSTMQMPSEQRKSNLDSSFSDFEIN